MLIESTRKDMHTVVISVAFEYLLCRLFGQGMLYAHDVKQEIFWKRVIRRITTAIEKSIEKNVQTDGFHKSLLSIYVDCLKRASKSKGIADMDVIHALTGIIFELLGGVPDYSRRKVINRSNDYMLNEMRTLQYSQSPFQRMRTILKASQFQPFCNHHKHDYLFNIYVAKYNGNPEGFIDWYKDKYPEVYLKLF